MVPVQVRDQDDVGVLRDVGLRIRALSPQRPEPPPQHRIGENRDAVESKQGGVADVGQAVHRGRVIR